MAGQKPQESEKEKIQMVTFKLGRESYGMPVMHVREIIKPVDIYPVPGVGKKNTGIINLRGEIIPVVEIASTLGVKVDEKRKDKVRRIIIVEAEEGSIGFVVDEVMEVVKISEEDISATPDIGGDQFAREVIRGVADIAGTMVVCIEPLSLVRSCVQRGELFVREDL